MIGYPHPTSNFFSSDFGNPHDLAGLALRGVRTPMLTRGYATGLADEPGATPETASGHSGVYSSAVLAHAAHGCDQNTDAQADAQITLHCNN